MRWQFHSLFTSKLWLNHSWFSVIWGFCAVVITCAVCFYFRNRITDTVCFCFRKLTSICIHTVKFTQPAPQENTAWFIDVPLFNLAQNLLSDATDNIFHCPAYLDVSLQQHQLLREHLWPHLCRGWATVRIIYVAVKSPHGLAELCKGYLPRPIIKWYSKNTTLRHGDFELNRERWKWDHHRWAGKGRATETTRRRRPNSDSKDLRIDVDTLVSGRYPIDVDPKVFAGWETNYQKRRTPNIAWN